MELRIFTEPQQGASYETLLTWAKLAEELNYDAFFRSDHYLRMGNVDGLPGPTDAWITLAGLARETSRIRLGTLVSSATFRAPGPFAIAVAQVDEMSGGRVDLGIGTGWYETEHTAYGIPFGASFNERFERLQEQLEIITGLWTTTEGQTFSFEGKHYTLKDSPALPKPRQEPHPPIIIGGFGPKRTPRLAAKYANEYNLAFMPVNIIEDRVKAVREACEKIGRDPTSLVISSAQVVCVGANEQEFDKRAEAIGRPADQLRSGGVAGTPDEALVFLGKLADAGVTRTYLQFLDLSDTDHARIVASEVSPKV
ncbi:MAG: LLM class F420-dependent oxidoreductase [Actinobacteria bacterium]|nr:LLM class F420-dependent oxidoreductase [Actinomycetota bacterium]